MKQPTPPPYDHRPPHCPTDRHEGHRKRMDLVHPAGAGRSLPGAEECEEEGVHEGVEGEEEAGGGIVSLRQERWRREARERLLREMGRCCWRCGLEPEDGVILQFDHPFGRNWSLERTSSSWRLSKYRADWRAGRLQLLCTEHHPNHVHRKMWPAPPDVVCPWLEEEDEREPLAAHGADLLQPF